MRRFFLAAIILGFVVQGYAQDWRVDANASKLGFSGVYQNEAFQGSFQKFDAVIRYAPDDLSGARFDVTIDITSVNTSNEERDSALAGEDFFFFSKYPKAHFITDTFSKNSDGVVLATGTLTLRGKSKPVSLEVKFAQTGENAVLDVATKLSRLDFDIGIGEWKDTDLIGAEVKVHGHLSLTRKMDN